MGAAKLLTTGGGAVILDAATTASDKTLTLPALDDVVTTRTTKIIQGTAVASTSGTSIDFTGIPSWVKRVTVMFNSVSTSGTSNNLIQIGAGSVDTTGYASAGTYAGPTNAAGGTNSTAGFVTAVRTNANITSGHFVITLVGSNIWVCSHTLGLSDTPYVYAGGGTKTLSGTLDRVRITTVNGTDTFDAGSVNILYE